MSIILKTIAVRSAQSEGTGGLRIFAFSVFDLEGQFVRDSWRCEAS